MKTFLTFLKVEGKLGLRCPDGLIFGVAMPVGILLLIVAIASGQTVAGGNYTFLQSAFASLITVGICATAFMGIPLTIADYRDKKILKHFFVTPVSPFRILLVQVCVGIITAIISALMVSLTAIFLFDYHMEGNIFLFIGAYFLVLLSMYSIGMMIASLCRKLKIANLVTTFVYFPMLFLSGASIPYEVFPETLQRVSDILPLTHGVKLLKEISLGLPLTGVEGSILYLCVCIIIGCIISIRCFRWE